MNIVVLTTETPHHGFFLMKLTGAWNIRLIICETQTLEAPFETRHPFEDQRDDYEQDAFFDGTAVRLREFAEVLEVTSANEPRAIHALADSRPDVVIVFGTRKLSPAVIATCPEGMINLHGGDPQYYRGLDSHLWATYHDDFEQLRVTLHRVNARLDDGEIVDQRPLNLPSGCGIHQLRHYNTETCVALVQSALRDFAARGSLSSRPQSRRGRYFSFMPAPLKDVCVTKFAAYTAGC